MNPWTWPHLVVLLSLLPCLTCEKLAYSPHDSLETSLDLVVQDLSEKYAQLEKDGFWHPYVYGTTDTPREGSH